VQRETKGKAVHSRIKHEIEVQRNGMQHGTQSVTTTHHLEDSSTTL
jgi:hypothetical protein